MPTNVEIPGLGDSVKSAVLIKWHKADGAVVAKDDTLCELETDKANVDLPSPAAGVVRHSKNEGDTVQVGETVARIEEGTGNGTAAAPAAKSVVKSTPPPTPVATAVAELSPATQRIVTENKLDPATIPATGPGGRLTKEDVINFQESAAKPSTTPPTTAPVKPRSETLPSTPAPIAPTGAMTFDPEGINRTPMSKMRVKIAERLVQAQQTAAILTTFNEVDLSEIMAIRARFKESFEKTHKVGLGFMSFFARATVLALKEFPRINAFIDGNDIVYHQHVHLGIAVSTERGLVVPVLRNVQDMGFAKFESEIKRLATAARDGKLGIPEMSGGTFTITNGGVFGSLLSTPILNPPQSGILGMHTIQKRPVATGPQQDKIEIRPMMYTALSYDHRLVDGRESVSFLVRLKQFLEDPARLMLEV